MPLKTISAILAQVPSLNMRSGMELSHLHATHEWIHSTKDNLKNNPIQDILSSIGISIPGNNLIQKYANEKPPMRAELFSSDQMENQGRSLASRHKLLSGRASNLLLTRLAENEEQLLEVHHLLTEAVKTNRRIIPAGEWLLDNFYLILEQIQTGKKHLPKGYSEDLPVLQNGPSAGLPRVYDIAVEIISHSDGRIDLKNLGSFVTAYQANTPLKLGELWAIPIMLRLALIENLRRLSTHIAFGRIHQNLADYWAEKMTTTAEKDPKNLILVIADMARSNPPIESAFVAELTRHLQGKGPALALPLNWIEHRLSETGQTGNLLINAEIQKQAAGQVSMSNSISSLRFLGAIDWRDFVESISIVEQILRRDINGTYPAMDFATRDSYRHVVEKLAKHSQLSEQEVANTAIHLARNAAVRNGEQDRTAHVGYYLVGKGFEQIEKGAAATPHLDDRLVKSVRRSPLLFYTGNILAITLLVGGALTARAHLQGESFWTKGWVLVLSCLCASQLAVTLVNWLSSIFIQPRLLPRMDFSEGIPPDCSTLVVIPSMLQDQSQIESLTESLEIYFLANKDVNLHFGLLTDFNDAPSATMPEDTPLLDIARQGIEDLNAKYAGAGKDVFFLFHRPRKWNPRDRVWMGYERKRGKLTELNALLRGEGEKDFSLIVGDPLLFPAIKYVITIDTDTKLPRDSARNIIAAMAHPLNRAVYCEKKKRVTEGYGILQPRVALSLSGSAHSLYARLHGTDLGIDPYTRMVSDVYQDLFDEGSFIGKGIYEIDIFRKGLDNRFPENTILSHDLLEGCFLRSGLLSDVQMYEEYPSRYSDDVKRMHRWTRGDWQIAAWCLPMIPVPGKGMQKNLLSGLSRWKIFDNLRRSLVPAALLILLIAGWTFLHDAWFWTLSIVALLLLPPLIIATRDILRKPKEIQMKQHFKDSIQAILNNLFQTFFTITCLPYEAFFTLDAIFRSIWRLVISHRHLLEWSLFVNQKSMQGEGLRSKYVFMLIAPALGIAGLLFLTVQAPMDHFVADPILILWILSPAIAWRLSRPLPEHEFSLDQAQITFLRRIARKTWGFFEHFVTREENWLPPDNYQEHPVERTAHRTSPTNIGLALMSNLAAVDLGYITAGTFIERTSGTFATLQTMERYKGHFYNWYDTITLDPLPPRYISTVDSGNLTGQLLTLRQGILAIPGEPVISATYVKGLRDTLLLLGESIKDPATLQPLHRILEAWEELDAPTFASLKPLVDALVDETIRCTSGSMVDPQSDRYNWSAALLRQCRDVQEEWNRFAGWTLMPPPTERLSGLLSMRSIPHLSELSMLDERLSQELSHRDLEGMDPVETQWLVDLKKTVAICTVIARQRLVDLDKLNLACLNLSETELDFLYDSSQHLLSIGYNSDEHRRDPSFYDLLASEARLSTFVGIAQGKLPQESWFALGRQLTHAGGESVLLSWSGSVFEYLMPLLYMPTYGSTLLDETYKVMVRRQIEYGHQLDVPWGISESGYNLVDASLNLQYRAFGVPELGLKRGLSEDLVIAPYASLMAVMIAPEEAYDNLRVLSANDMEGRFGFYEAIDYTPSRLPRGQSSAAIRSFMAHHQGMGLLALDYLLQERPMQRRFESEPQFQATLLLLQERIPKTTKFYAPPPDIANISIEAGVTEMRVIQGPDTPVPEVQLLSNGDYHVMVTNAGGGYSRWRNIAVTRWHEDGTCDNWGNFCFIRDLEKGDFWSTAHQPALKTSKSYEAVFSQGRAEFRRMDNDIETHTEIAVSPEDDVEIRRVHLTNRSKRKRYIELTSYAEVVLAPAAADNLHPAFSNLFVQTELIPQKTAILCTRRPRSSEEAPPWMFHLMRTNSNDVQDVSYETDRMRFIGRGRTIANPKALKQSAVLSGTQGPVLDPVVSIQYRITLQPMESVTMDMVYGIAEMREACEGLIVKYQDPSFIDRAFELAWTHSQIVLRQINATESDAQLYSRLAGSVIYPHATHRADAAILLKNHKGQSGLWSYSISGDLPIVLLQISDIANIGLVKQLVQAHAYWRLKGLVVDLVIWNEDYGGYRQLLQNQLLGLISAGAEIEATERPGGIFVRVSEQIAIEDRILIQSVARLVLSDSRGSLASQVGRRTSVRPAIPAFSPKQPRITTLTPPEPAQEMTFFNGLGGFSKDGKEYIIHTDRSKPTPLPWSNVLSNARFGTVISESGQSYTWFENAH
jgi:cyclic beta-1,2-glucan synthetase